jgi:uncharacterized protein (TIGR02246 family)
MLEKFEGVTPTQESTETMQEIASRNFGIWNRALQTGNPKEVAALYIADATFLPTVSGEFKKGQYGAEEYFKHFLEKNPTGEIIQEEVQTLGTDCYLHSGIYNFEVSPGDDRQVVEARFSFVWKKDDQGEWKIVHHHSSAKPEKKQQK